jgi:hypothetical protein
MAEETPKPVAPEPAKKPKPQAGQGKDKWLATVSGRHPNLPSDLLLTMTDAPSKKAAKRILKDFLQRSNPWSSSGRGLTLLARS